MNLKARPKAVSVSAVIERSSTPAFDEDSVLVERFLGGDSGAFDQLYARYYDRVYAMARGVLGDADEAADAVQEVFALLYRNLARFDRRSRFGTWLFRVAVNRTIQYARRNKRLQRNRPLNEAAGAIAEPTEQPADPRVQSAMAKLSPQDRVLLVLFYWEELSLQEIADSVGCGVNAAKTRLYRARERFRVFYEEEPE